MIDRRDIPTMNDWRLQRGFGIFGITVAVVELGMGATSFGHGNRVHTASFFLFLIIVTGATGGMCLVRSGLTRRGIPPVKPWKLPALMRVLTGREHRLLVLEVVFRTVALLAALTGLVLTFTFANLSW